MRRYCMLIFLVLLIPAQCIAMAFSSPRNVGRIIAVNIGGYAFEGETSNNGIKYEEANKRRVYLKGIASFSDGNEALYFHYEKGDYRKGKPDVMLLGAREAENTVAQGLMLSDIYKIKTIPSTALYMVHDSYDLYEENRYILIGKNRNGRWVKYFDTDEIATRYFGKREKMWSDKSIWFDKWNCADNRIVIQYSRFRGRASSKTGYVKEGEFRFKWDDNAQWFSVEHVIY